MANLQAHLNLPLERCPHCQVARPVLALDHRLETKNHSGTRLRNWWIYACRSCGGVVIAGADEGRGNVVEYLYPAIQKIDEALPTKAREYLSQSVASVHAPAGAVMLAASAVDAMLKEKGYKSGSLYERIEKAQSDHLITAEMAAWAHEVRLDANDQRHADEDGVLPDEAVAEKTISFARALAEYLFVLPGRVQKGRQRKQDGKST
ncbi:MAG: DUF4145 domain-containing protein [Ectothiorhodospiraceae bacterium]|nr:DUF4145 domain-containing protein [Ectothiorhodospiraceae bacterium]